MFDVFRESFSRDNAGETIEIASIAVPDILGLRELLKEFGGASFRDGLYRVIHPADLDQWKGRISYAFPRFDGRVFGFGYDWLGRVFALDSSRLEDGQPAVVMFEPGTGEALEIPSNLQAFHDVELKEFGEAALAVSFYEILRNNGGPAPAISQCVGYRTPLFLGGKDSVENLELTDLDVYWHISGQLIRKAKNLPVGTKVRVSTG